MLYITYFTVVSEAHDNAVKDDNYQCNGFYSCSVLLSLQYQINMYELQTLLIDEWYLSLFSVVISVH